MASAVSSPRRLPSDPPEPDLSHLTEEERKIIEGVLQRQKAEAQKDHHIISNLEQDVQRLEASIKKQIAQGGSGDSGVITSPESDTCRICNKVKFAGGAGYTCHYCQLKSCSRCGGRLTLKAKSIWACNLCRKKQELALKTGQWYHGVRGAQGLQRRGSLVRQTSLSSDTETGGGRRSRDMHITGAAKRSSSAHALTATDTMDENGNHSRMNLRMLGADSGRSNGDVSRPRLRGELETTPFIIPKSKPNIKQNPEPKFPSSPSTGSRPGMTSKLNTSNTSLQQRERSESSDNKSVRSPGSSLSSKADSQTNRVPGPQSPNHPMQPQGRGFPPQTQRVSPHTDRNLPPGHTTAHPAGSSDSTIRDRTSSTSSRRSDSSRRSQERITPSNSRPHNIDADQHRHREHDHTRPPSRNQMSRHGGSSDRLSETSSTQHTAAIVRSPQQRPDPAPRRGPPEPAARPSRCTPTEDIESQQRGAEPHAAARRTNSAASNSGSMGREDRPYPGQPDPRVSQSDPRVSNRNIPMILHNGGDPDDQYHSNNPSVQQHGRDNGDQHRREGTLQEAREQNSSQESSNSTNLSNKLSVPGPHSQQQQQQQQAEYDYQHGGTDTMKSARSRRREMAMLHTDSLSSDPSDCVRPPPPKPHKHRKVKAPNGKPGQPGVRGHHEISSSEDEMRSTTSCGDDLCESESLISEKAPYSGSRSHRVYDDRARSDELIAAKIKNFLAVSYTPDVVVLSFLNGYCDHPVTWKRSGDGKFIIGHMILSKTLGPDGQPTKDAGNILGLKVIGGKMTEEGRLGAFITRVKEGSIADTVGHLLPDDEVIEWNGRSLRGATLDEVYEVILESKQEPQVELIVQRRYSPTNLPPELQKRDDGSSRNELAPSVTVTAPASPGMARRLMSITHVTGKIQLKLWYSNQQHELIITVLSASELPLVEGNQPPQAYCKVYLLPDSGEVTKRVTRPVARTREPEWRQTFTYQPVSKAEFQEKSMEVTVWNLTKSGQSEFLGEIVIELSTAKLNNEALWYRLRHHEEASGPLPKNTPRSNSSLGTSSVGGAADAGPRYSTKQAGRSQSRSRVSDTASEISEQDMEENDVMNRGRDRHGDMRSGGPYHQQQQRRPTPSHSMHSSREDVRSTGPSPVPRRRQLPNLPPGSPGNGSMSDREHAFIPTLTVEGVAFHRVPMTRRHTHNTDSPRRHRGGESDRGDDRYLHHTRRHRDRYYSESRASPDLDENFMSDASDSMRSTQSERPNRATVGGLRNFTSRMESRISSGRRQVLPSHTNGGGSPHNASGYLDNHDHGSMSDSGVSSAMTERRMNRMRMGGRDGGSSNQLSVTDSYGRQHFVRDDTGLPNRRLHKQTSKDSTDGSICSFSSDSSNAELFNAIAALASSSTKEKSVTKPVVAEPGTHRQHDRRSSLPSIPTETKSTASPKPLQRQMISNLSQQIEGLNLNSHDSALGMSNGFHNGVVDPHNNAGLPKQTSNNNMNSYPPRRESDIPQIAARIGSLPGRVDRRPSDMGVYPQRRDSINSDRRDSINSDRPDSYMVAARALGDRRDSDISYLSDRRDSFTSNISSCYEDDLAMARMSEQRQMPFHNYSPRHPQDSMDTNNNMDNNSLMRLNELTHQRAASPRRLPVNEAVVAASNPNAFNQPAGKPGIGVRGSSLPGAVPAPGFHLDSGYQSSNSSLHSSALPQNSQQPQFPFVSGGQPSTATLTGAQRLAIANQGAHVRNSQWAQPRNGGEGLNDFIEGLGPGQIVGRQVLGTSCLGEIQMGLSDKKGRLELEIIRARGLVSKPGAKVLPVPYVKAYLMDANGKNCAEKLKTTSATRKTLDPFYNQILIFMEPYMQKILQVMVWGDYGRMDRKVFMGVAQVNLDDLDLSNIVFGWYKLFTTSSIVGSAARRSSQSSLDSAYSGSR